MFAAVWGIQTSLSKLDAKQAATFSSAIGIWPLGEQSGAKYNSKYRPKGTAVFRPGVGTKEWFL